MKWFVEDFLVYFNEKGVFCKWFYSELDVFECVEFLCDLCEGKFEVLVGVNLLWEGFDFFEVLFVVIFDVDKEGFFCSEMLLI